jgi:hypothetical protein
LNASLSFDRTNLVAAYQWQRGDNLGGFTNIPNATATSYTTPVLGPADDASQFRLLVVVPAPVSSATRP